MTLLTCTRYESLETEGLPFVCVYVMGKVYSSQNKHIVADVSSYPAPFFRQKSTWSSLHTFLPLRGELHLSYYTQVASVTSPCTCEFLILNGCHSTVLASVSLPPLEVQVLWSRTDRKWFMSLHLTTLDLTGSRSTKTGPSIRVQP
jgi:hypothetical protein